MTFKLKISRSLSFLSTSAVATTLTRSYSTKKVENVHGRTLPKMADGPEKNVSAADQAAQVEALLASTKEVLEAADLLFNNQVDAAKAKLVPKAGKEIYHAMGLGLLQTVQAFMSFEPADIETALETLKQSDEVCNRKRHKTTMTNNLVTKMVVRPNYNSYTEEECHAELCYAECLLFRAIVTFIQDDNFVSFIKGALWIRSCFQTYKACADMVEHRTWPNKVLKEHFQSGVYLGVGTFNLMISSLPTRVIKMLEFVGFSGNKEVGMQCLDDGSKLLHTIRGVFSSLVILLYYIILAFALGPGSKNFKYLDTVIEPLNKKYTKSTLFEFMRGRYENCRGNVDKAEEHLEKSLSFQIDWPKFKHFSHWEITWCNMLKGKWRAGIPHIEVLIEENKWSRATYSFIKAALLLMSDDITAKEKAEVIEIMKKVPDLRLHIAGKSIPLEKFWCKKAVKFIEQDNWLLHPIYEMLYVWNYFLFLKGHNDILSKIIGQMDRAIDDLKARKDWSYYGDNYCLALFIKGLCLRYMDSPLSAEECFKEVILNQKILKDDTHLVSCASLELGLICTDTGNLPVAVQCFDAARNERAFFLEFRAHHGYTDASALLKKKKTGSNPTTPVSSTYKSFNESEQFNQNNTKL